MNEFYHGFLYRIISHPQKAYTLSLTAYLCNDSMLYVMSSYQITFKSHVCSLAQVEKQGEVYVKYRFEFPFLSVIVFLQNFSVFKVLVVSHSVYPRLKIKWKIGIAEYSSVLTFTRPPIHEWRILS